MIMTKKTIIRGIAVTVLTVVILVSIISWGRDSNWSYVYHGVNDDALKRCTWKSLHGAYIGDFLYFRSEKCKRCPFEVDDEYFIFRNGIKIGKVINATNRRLTVITLDGRRGYYDCK